jgi:hypothetical protein
MINPLKTKEGRTTRSKKSKDTYSRTRTRSRLKLDEYKGPITKSKSKQLSVLRSEKSTLEVSSDMVARDEQPRDEHHEERQGGERYSARNQGIPGFRNRRRVSDSPLNLTGELHELPVLPKGTLKEFSGDGTIDAKRHLHLFLDVYECHRVEYDDIMVRLFLQTLSERSYEWCTTLPGRWIRSFNDLEDMFLTMFSPPISYHTLLTDFTHIGLRKNKRI